MKREAPHPGLWHTDRGEKMPYSPQTAILPPKSSLDEADQKIRAYLQASLRVSPRITNVSADQIQRMQFPEGGRQTVKFLDKRR